MTSQQRQQIDHFAFLRDICVIVPTVHSDQVKQSIQKIKKKSPFEISAALIVAGLLKLNTPQKRFEFVFSRVSWILHEETSSILTITLPFIHHTISLEVYYQLKPVEEWTEDEVKMVDDYVNYYSAIWPVVVPKQKSLSIGAGMLRIQYSLTRDRRRPPKKADEMLDTKDSLQRQQSSRTLPQRNKRSAIQFKYVEERIQETKGRRQTEKRLTLGQSLQRGVQSLSPYRDQCYRIVQYLRQQSIEHTWTLLKQMYPSTPENFFSTESSLRDYETLVSSRMYGYLEYQIHANPNLQTQAQLWQPLQERQRKSKLQGGGTNSPQQNKGEVHSKAVVVRNVQQQQQNRGRRRKFQGGGSEKQRSQQT